MGAIAGALIGFGYGGDEEAVEAGAELGAEAMAENGGHLIPEEDAWYVADAIPNGSAAAIILLEHLWAIPLRDAIVDAGGIALADEWIHAERPDRGRCRGGRRVERSSRVRVAAEPCGHPGLRGAARRLQSMTADPAPTEHAAPPTPASSSAAGATSLLLVSRRDHRRAGRDRCLLLPRGGRQRRRSTCSTTLPGELGFDSQPSWWPIPLLALSGLLVALTIRYLPGTAGHKPAEGFKTSGAVQPIELPGIIIAAFATLSLGVVLGPEAPLIAIGSGLGVLAVHLLKRDAPEMASVVIGAAGSFAAISTLLGSPLAGAFLLMEAGGLGGAMMGVVLVPGPARRRHRVARSTSGSTTGPGSGRSRSRFRTSPPPAARRERSSSGRSRSASSPRSLGTLHQAPGARCSSRSSSGGWCS